MKILFLDMDGVLNSHEFLYTKRNASRTRWNGTVESWATMVDPEAVERLNKVIEATGAEICLSSSWRYAFRHALPKFTEVLRAKGYLGPDVKYRTPTGHEMPKGYSSGNVVIRGQEVATWLHEHPGVTHYAIVDDSNDFGPLLDRLVQTRWSTGMLDEHVAPLIEMLGREA